MKKIAIIISILWIASFGIQAQTGKVRYLQVEAADKTVRLNVDEKIPYSIKAEKNENNQLMVMVYKGGTLVAMYPEGTKIYPKYDNPVETEPTATLVDDKVVVYSPANGTTMEENILEYIPNRKIVFKMPSSSYAPGFRKSVSTNESDVKITNFNTNMPSDLFPGMCISIPPNNLAPDGGLLKIDNIENGAGSVILWGEQPTIPEVLDQAISNSKISFFDNFNKASFSMPTKIDGLDLNVTLDKIDDKKTISISITADYNLLKNEPSKNPDKPETTAKADVKIKGACELRNAVLTPRIIKAHGKLLPEAFDFTLDGELNFSITATVDVNIAEKLGKSFRVGEIPLGVIPIAGTPIYISPKLRLDIELGAKGSLKWEWECLDYTYPFNFYAGYYQGNWDTKGNEQKGYFTYHDIPLVPDVKGSIYEDIKLGLVAQVMDFEGVEINTGGGITPAADFKYTAEKKELEIDINSPLYAFCTFELSTLFGTQLKWGVTRELATWHLWNTKINFDADNPEPMLIATISDILPLPASGGTRSITIESNVDWTVSTDVSWIKIALPSSGSNDGTVGITVDENTSTDSRTATITITGGGVTRTIPILQEGMTTPNSELSATLSDNSLLPASGGTREITITSNTDWTVSSDATWLTISPVSGSNDGTVTVTAEVNTATDTREATITISGTGVTAQTISVTQEAANSGGGDDEEGVVINGVRWATRNVDAPGTFAKNPEDPGMFYQWNRKVGWSATDPLINSDGGNTWDNSFPTGDTWEKANDPSPAGWRVPTYAEQLKLLDTNNVIFQWVILNGAGGCKFTDKFTGNSIFLPAAGYRDKDNSILHIVGTLGIGIGCYWSGSMNQSIGAYVLQFSDGIAADWYGAYRNSGQSVRAVANNEPLITLSISPSSLNFSASGEQQTLNVTSNTDWTVSSDATWLTISPVSGSNDGTVTVTAEVNTTESQRTATVTISGTNVTAQTINIIQEAVNSNAKGTWERLADYPLERTGNVDLLQFAIGNKIYIGNSDNYEYDVSSDTWTRKSIWKDQISQEDAIWRIVTSFAINNTGYIVGIDSNDKVTIHEYNPQIDEWSGCYKSSDFISRWGGFDLLSFVINDKAYIVDYQNGSMFEFDPSTKDFHRKSSFPGNIYSMPPNATANTNKGYIGLGYTHNSSASGKELWEYNPISDTWLQLSDFPIDDGSDNGGILFADDDYLYFARTDNRNSLKLWRFNIQTKQWSEFCDIPKELFDSRNGILLGAVIYLGLSISSDGSGVYYPYWYKYIVNN